MHPEGYLGNIAVQHEQIIYGYKGLRVVLVNKRTEAKFHLGQPFPEA